MSEGSWENLWSLKSILRGFELVSRLKVNFYKSKLYGINLEDHFLNAASAFISCSVDKFPFRFLGLPVGANLRRCDTWKPVVDAMKKKLSSWNGRSLFIGGRVTLINSVLSSLPLYYFAFFKAPEKIVNELIKIQRMFLWGGCSEQHKTCWVSWKQVCLPKNKGGLGVKDLELFNISLLNKWKWRCLTNRMHCGMIC